MNGAAAPSAPRCPDPREQCLIEHVEATDDLPRKTLHCQHPRSESKYPEDHTIGQFIIADFGDCGERQAVVR